MHASRIVLALAVILGGAPGQPEVDSEPTRRDRLRLLHYRKAIKALEERVGILEQTVDRLSSETASSGDPPGSPAKQQFIQSEAAEVWRIGELIKTLALEQQPYMAYLSVSKPAKEAALELRDDGGFMEGGNVVQALVRGGVPKVGLYSGKTGIASYIKDDQPVLQFRDKNGVTRLQLGILQGLPVIAFHDANGIAVKVLGP